MLCHDTHTATPVAIIDNLEPQTWYTFRVASVDPHNGTGYGSAPSKPARTRAVDKFAVRVSPHGRPPARASGEEIVSVGHTAAAATVVARGAETTPPLTEEENAFASLAISHTLEAARLRKALCKWDITFEKQHGRSSTDEERLGAAERTNLLQTYQALEQERQRLGEATFGDLSLEDVSGGGTMALQKRVLAARLANEARSLYGDMLTQRCASLLIRDGLSALTSPSLEGAIQLFARSDKDVDGQLSPAEFSALYAWLADVPGAGSAARASIRNWHVAFRRADLTNTGHLDLNELVVYLEGGGNDLGFLIAEPPQPARRVDIVPSPTVRASQQSDDAAMLADAEYQSLVIEQAQSAGTQQFCVDQLPDHRLLLRAMRLFRRHDHQRRGYLDLADFISLIAPPLERMLAQREGVLVADDSMAIPPSPADAYAQLAKAAAATATAVRERPRPLRLHQAQQAAAAGREGRGDGRFAPWHSMSDGAWFLLPRAAVQVADGGTPIDTVGAVGQGVRATLGMLGKLPQAALGCLATADALAVKEHPAKQGQGHSTSGAHIIAAVGVAQAGSAPALAGRRGGARWPSEAEQQTFPRGANQPSEVEMERSASAVEFCRELFKLADADANGAVDFNEWISLLMGGAITRVAQGLPQAERAMHEVEPKSGGASDGTMGSAGEQVHRARMVERVMKRVGRAEGEHLLSGVYDASRSEAVELFAAADVAAAGELNVAEFSAALASAQAQGLLPTAVSADGRRLGEMEARLWFTALDSEHRDTIDIAQWLELLDSRFASDGRAASLKQVAGQAARITSRLDRPMAAADGRRHAESALELLELPPAGSVASPRRRPVLQGLTAAAEAAEDAAFAAAEAARAEASAEQRNREDERLHRYLSKVVSQASTAYLSSEGAAALAAVSEVHLHAVLALFERFDSDGDGRLQEGEFESMLTQLTRQHGVRFGAREVSRLFQAADLANTGSVDVVEVLLILEQLALAPIAPAEAEAYREPLASRHPAQAQFSCHAPPTL